MRKIHILIAIIFSGITCFSCQNNIEETTPLYNTFTATIGSITKTAVDGYDVIWNKDDVIKICGVEYKAEEAGNRVTFTPVSGSGTSANEYFAFYPKTISQSGDAASSANCTLPSSYTWDANGSYLPMYAHGTNTNLRFFNLCAVLKVNVPNDFEVKKVVVEGPEGMKLNGDFIIEASNMHGYITGQKAVASQNSNGTNCVTVEAGTAMNGGTIYIPIPENTYSTLKITIYDGNNQSVKIGNLNNFAVLASSLYTINIANHADYFYIEATANGTISFSRQVNAHTDGIALEYSTDKQTWNDFFVLASGETVPTTTTISTAAGTKYYFRAKTTNSRFGYAIDAVTTENSVYQFQITGTVKIGGNIMYLLDSDGSTTMPDGAFPFFFEKNYNSITDASELILPNDTNYMCYASMFAWCWSLSKAPELPAMSAANSCYQTMFYHCTSLTSAPALPATTLGEKCYSRMFDGCTSLRNCTSVEAGTEVKLPATTLADNCYEGMFDGCTNIKIVPILPATQLKKECYKEMFQGCSMLTSVVMNATTIPETATNCFSNWLDGAGINPPDNNTPGLTINNDISSINEGVGLTIAENTPSQWSIWRNGTRLRVSSYEGITN